MVPIQSDPSAIPLNTTASPSPATSAKSKPVDSVEQQKLKKAAGEFESILLASMWKSMKESFTDPKDNSDPAGGTINDWGIEVMSGAVGKAGGLGIGNLIIKHLGAAADAPSAEKPAAGANVFGNLADRMDRK